LIVPKTVPDRLQRRYPTLHNEMNGFSAVSVFWPYGITVVEDAAESLGSFYHGRRVGV